MEILLIVGVIVFVALYLLGRYISTGAAKLLSDEDKARIVDFSIQQRKVSIPVMLGLVAVIYVLPRVAPFIFLAAIVGLIWYQQSKLTKLDFPAPYRKRFLLGTLITYGGLIIFFLFSLLAPSNE